MRASEVECVPVKEWRGQPARVAVEKIDGNRLMISKTDGEVRALGKDKRAHLDLSRKLRGLDWFERLLEALPDNTAIDGELYVPGAPSREVRHALASAPATLRYAPFAAPMIAGELAPEDGPAEHVLALKWWMDRHELGCFMRVPAMLILEPDAADNWEAASEELRRLAQERGYEGWVLREKAYSEWYKVKVYQTADLVCTGFKDGDGKYIGLVGSIQGSVYDDGGNLIHVCNCSGMDDEVRLNIDEKRDLGRVFEVRYERLDRSRLRHPRFVQWRDDKIACAENCHRSQIAGL